MTGSSINNYCIGLLGCVLYRVELEWHYWCQKLSVPSGVTDTVCCL